MNYLIETSDTLDILLAYSKAII